jgi:large subunit ribosomal protein L17
LNEKIETTEAKAKAIKGLVDTLVTQAKSPNTRRLVSQFLTDKNLEERLVSDLAPRLSDRNSGYTSVVKLGLRPGDGAMVVQMSLLLSSELVAKKSETRKEAVKSVTNEVAVKSAKTEKVETAPRKRVVKAAKKS